MHLTPFSNSIAAIPVPLSLEFLVWSFMAMVIGSIVFSSNPRETLWKYMKGFASFMSWVISYLVRHVLSSGTLAPFSLTALLTLYVSSPQFTEKTNPIEQDIITLRESLKVSNKAIDDLKNTLKHNKLFLYFFDKN